MQKYQKKNYYIYIYVYRKDIPILESYLDDPTGVEILSIDKINNFWLRSLNYIFKRFFTNPEFSEMYIRQRKKDRDGLFHKYLGSFFYIKNDQINQEYQKFFGIFSKNLQSRLLISISRIKANHLICSKNIKHIAIMESWDHAVKSPCWHEPDYLLTWNASLKKDYIEYQNFKTVKISYIKPLKFRYIEERKKKTAAELENELSNRSFLSDLDMVKRLSVVMYIPMTSSLNPTQHVGEMKLIDQLCQATEKLHKVLYIKPKPNGPVGDYDCFAERYSNVIVGTYATNPNSIDMLDEEYHTFRYLLLLNSDLIINYGTTFVLEAALMDKPILQLNLSTEDYGEFGEYSKNLHIKRYLLNENSVEVSTVDEIMNILCGSAFKFESFSKEMKKWILGG